MASVQCRHRKAGQDSSDDSDEDYRAVCERIQQSLMARVGVGGANPYDALDDGDEDDEKQAPEEEQPAAPADDSDNDGFEEVRHKKRKPDRPAERHGVRVNPYKASKKKCEYLSQMYNAYFELLTGINPHFTITPESQPFISQFEACMRRDRLMITLFNERPTFVDAFGGSGADSFACMFNMFPLKILMNDSQPVHHPDVLRLEGGFMHRNCANLQAQFKVLSQGIHGQPPPQIVPTTLDCRTFMLSLEKGMRLDILNLDPPWALPGAEFEMSAEELANYLEHEVFGPMRERRIVPQCIVFKTRWDAGFTHLIMDKLGDKYHAEYSVQATPFHVQPREQGGEWKEVKGTFHWVVIVHSELKDVMWHRTMAYDRLFKEHKDVIVLKENFVGANVPNYASQIKDPVMVEHEDGDRTLRVKAPVDPEPHRKKRAKA
jgi:hypothetical protein